MAIPTLQSARLTIREFRDADSEARRALIEDAFGAPVSEQDNADWMRWTLLSYRQLESLHQPPYGDYAIIENASGAMVGSIGLVPSAVPWGILPEFRAGAAPPTTTLTPEFGLFWAVAARFRGLGYAGEAAEQFIRTLFEVFHYRRVVATTERSNAASQRVMHKLGMKLYENPGSDPFWFEVVGLLEQPG